MGMNSELGSYTITVYELQQAGFNFGLEDYPIFDEEYRPILNEAILNYYMFREIGFINPNIWKFKLNARMSRIMRDKYNDLYKAKKTEFNPLYNVDLTETFSHEVNNTGNNTNNGETNTTNTSNITDNGTSTNENTVEYNGNQNTATTTKEDVTNNNLQLNSQFPSEEMTENDLTSNLFVDNATKTSTTGLTNTTNNENTTNNDDTTTNDTTETTNKQDINNTGKITNTTNGTQENKTIETYTRTNLGSSAGLPFSKALLQLKQFYDKYDLDKQVINELKDLFISCW